MTKSKQRILKIASELFSEFGFLGVSMGDIAKKLNITKAALYYHFNSKKDLYFEVLEKAFQGLIKTINKEISKAKSPKEYLFQLIRGYLKFGLKEKNLIKSLVLKIPDSDLEITNYIAKLREKINHQFQIILKGIFKNGLWQKIDLKFITSSLLGIMDRLILEAALLDKKLNVKKSASQVLQIISPILRIGKKVVR